MKMKNRETMINTLNSINVYGRSKLAGENFVKDIMPKHYIIRCAWLYGGTKSNIVTTILERALKGEKIEQAVDQISTPTNVDDLSKGIRNILESGQYSTYHVTNQGYCSRYEMGKIILNEAGLQEDSIIPISLSDDKRIAKRPSHTVLKNMMLSSCGFQQLQPFEASLRNYVSSLKSR